MPNSYLFISGERGERERERMPSQKVCKYRDENENTLFSNNFKHNVLKTANQSFYLCKSLISMIGFLEIGPIV